MILVLQKTLVAMTMICVIFYQPLAEQSLYSISDSKESSMTILGTSTLHKWTMQSHILKGKGYFNLSGESNELKSIDSLTFSVIVKDLKSDEKKLDKNAYKALKSDDYKDIAFKLTSSAVAPLQKNKYLIKATGNLTIAGVTRPITMDVSCEVKKGNIIYCSGSEKLNMTDYHVTPPSFLLGAMKTGDSITLEFKLLFDKKHTN